MLVVVCQRLLQVAWLKSLVMIGKALVRCLVAVDHVAQLLQCQLDICQGWNVYCYQDDGRELPRQVERITLDRQMFQSGRLLIRKLIAEKLKIPWNEIQLKRTTKGKPFLAHPVLDMIPNFNFNISHQGDYTVLAAEPVLQVGIDIMKTNFPGSTSVTKFFRIMNRQFTDLEWNTINMAGDEWSQLDMFYRHWALKESFIKAVGVGVAFDLQRIEFHVSPLHLEGGQIYKETIMFLDGEQEEAWAFEAAPLVM